MILEQAFQNPKPNDTGGGRRSRLQTEQVR
jgi:hypothetical protein